MTGRKGMYASVQRGSAALAIDGLPVTVKKSS